MTDLPKKNTSDPKKSPSNSSSSEGLNTSPTPTLSKPRFSPFASTDSSSSFDFIDPATSSEPPSPTQNTPLTPPPQTSSTPSPEVPSIDPPNAISQSERDEMEQNIDIIERESSDFFGQEDNSDAPVLPEDEMANQQPVVNAVALGRDRNIISWLTLLALICFGIALWTPLERLFFQIRNRYSAIFNESDLFSDHFLAISYEGVSSAPIPGSGLISTPRFHEHITALKNAGFTPITINDVHEFYTNKRSLPEKAILLTFENGRKSTYFETREFLSSIGWHAVMGVVTKPVREESPDVILRTYLHTMCNDPTWELANQSDSGTELIPTSPDGGQSLFFASPMWLQRQNRREQFSELIGRIENDHTNSLAWFDKNLKLRPRAFFFPNGNYGQFLEQAEALREANLSAVSSHYGLGFILNKTALNDKNSDPCRLNRFQVPPEFSASQLLTHLENSWPVKARRSFNESNIDASRWIADWGTLERRAKHFILRADGPHDPLRSDAGSSGGGRAWILGSNSFMDGTFSTRFHLIRGEFYAYFRFNADDSWIRVAIADSGRASVSQCISGHEPKILANDSLIDISDFRSMHSLFVTIRDDVIFVRVDGKLLFNGAVIIKQGNPGMVGVSVWAPQPALAQISVEEANLRARIDAITTWVPSLNRNATYLVNKLRETAFRYTIISPPWLDVYASSPITFPQIDSIALGIIAHANHNRLFPTLSLHDTDALITLKIDEIVSHLLRDGANGVFIDASDFPVDGMMRLQEWIKNLRELLLTKQLGLAIRFPDSIAHLSAVPNFLSQMPDVLIVNDSGFVHHGIDSSRVLLRNVIDPPTSDSDIKLFFQLCDYKSSRPDAIAESEAFRKNGLKAYAEGDYAKAVEQWSLWQEKDPASAEAWAYLGNAYTRIRNYDRASDAYGESLQLEPGQIQTMIQRVHVLESANRMPEAEVLLDSYARAFPENMDIAIEQAQWLDRHDHRSAGRTILRTIVTNSPANIRCRLALQNLLDSPVERYQNMHELLQLGTSHESQLLGFGNDILSAELLTITEASVFFDFIRKTSKSENEMIRTLYSSFMPLTNSISEHFDTSRLSDNWIAFGTPLTFIAGKYDLKAASDMSEAYLRLKQSELMRDGFIEVTLGESVGAFWLYGRRSSRSMIRFGFDGDGYVRIQTWRDGEIRTGDSIAWIRPPGDITLRLEIRGDGAIGMIDGKPMFQTPLKIPADVSFGWWSVSPFSPELGIARARIGRIVAGPMSPSLLLMRETDPTTIQKVLDDLRPNSRAISAIAPVLFAQNSDGVVLSTPLADLMPYRLFCSYHRIRLMPIAALDYYSDVPPDTLLRIFIENRLDGLVLIVRNMPAESWFEEMTKLLELTTSDLIVIETNDPFWPKTLDGKMPEFANVREIQRGNILFQPDQVSWKLDVHSYDKWEPMAKRQSNSIPTLVVIPKASENERKVLADASNFLEEESSEVENNVPEKEAPTEENSNVTPAEPLDTTASISDKSKNLVNAIHSEAAAFVEKVANPQSAKVGIQKLADFVSK